MDTTRSSPRRDAPCRPKSKCSRWTATPCRDSLLPGVCARTSAVSQLTVADVERRWQAGHHHGSQLWSCGRAGLPEPVRSRRGRIDASLCRQSLTFRSGPSRWTQRAARWSPRPTWAAWWTVRLRTCSTDKAEIVVGTGGGTTATVSVFDVSAATPTRRADRFPRSWRCTRISEAESGWMWRGSMRIPFRTSSWAWE